jgi:SNF2 family DNA or RNA helicase
MQIVGYKNLGQLQKIVKTFSSQVLKEECLDLPEKIYKKHIVELTDEQYDLYNTLRNEAMVTLDSGESLEVTNALALVTKLHQVSCGQLKLEDGSYKSIPNNRIDALLSILEDYKGKVIIWANYRQTLIDLVEALQETYGPESTAPYFGGVSDSARKDAITNFQDMNHPLRFFVANPQSAGYGLTLTAAHLVIYYSNGYSLEHRLQSEDRAHRIGQTNKVTYIDIVTPDTIDERIFKILRDKKNIADFVMDRATLKEWL